MFKKFSLIMLATVISSNTYAEIIELDAINPDHCRQQLLKSTDELPVIAAYTSNPNDGNSKLFMKKFELLAKGHPDRTFFKWDAKKDLGHVTQSLCLQQLGFFVPPNIMLVGIVKDKNIGTIMTTPLRLQWAGQMKTEDMNSFIDVSDPEMRASFLSQKNRPN